ncbi:MAG: hypothetical protein RIB86_05910 [Imperialibacter sp.]
MKLLGGSFRASEEVMVLSLSWSYVEQEIQSYIVNEHGQKQKCKD